MQTMEISVWGLIQGVGFRPFIYRLATELGLTGWVLNSNENVLIRVTGAEATLVQFIQRLEESAPSASSIERIEFNQIEPEFFPDFRIMKSADHSDAATEISPDIMVCQDCIDDLHQSINRSDYPFVNCTNCGPRFTIISSLPYDRNQTTMKDFPMCPDCRSEYEDIGNRRFHAQPIACNHCGPVYSSLTAGHEFAMDQQDLVKKMATFIDSGKVILLKGLGGMHLACDARQEKAVSRLREVKLRDGKPFAMMVRNLHIARQVAYINEEEEKALLSWQRPIVLLRQKNTLSEHPLAPGICSGLNQVGIMLPYMPVHYMLFDRMKSPVIVLTSANRSHAPILIENKKAMDYFGHLADACFLHNRDILNRSDDSVVKIIGGMQRLFRRSRGFVPSPVRTTLYTEGILAFGADLANSFCLGKGRNAILSQYIGDLQEAETMDFFNESLSRFRILFRFKPELAVADLHPDYHSTTAALSQQEIPVIRIQHHHAHIAACMAENRLDETVIGVAFDGTGFGIDGNIWGSEFFIADLLGFKRKFHFSYLKMPGGDKGSEEPWRMAVSWLYSVFGEGFRTLEIPFLQDINQEDVDVIIQMMDKNIHCPLTCGAGRYFDAVAALAGLCSTATFHAEGPMRLENAVEPGIKDSYPFTIGESINFDDCLKSIVEDISNNTAPSVISTKFHNTIISAIFETITLISQETGLGKVVLSGGVFQNKYLLEGCISGLEKADFKVYTHQTVPSNDGGIALGQLVIAAKKREMICV